MKINKFVLMILIAVLIIIVLTIVYEITRGPSLLADSTCKLPCWNQVKLGETNSAEFHAILAHVASVDQKNTTTTEFQKGAFYNSAISFTTQNNGTGFYRDMAEAMLLNDRVIELDFNGETDLTLARAIEQFGTPDHAFAFYGPGGLYDVKVNVFFERAAIVVGFRLTSIEAEIKPEQSIDFISIVELNYYQKVLKSGVYTYFLENVNLHNWTGYGSVKDKYWPPDQP
jgi:hypothetical protein